VLKFIMTRTALIACLCSLSVSAYAVADGTKHAINIASEDLSTALEQLSKQSGTDLVYRPEQVRGYSTRALIGQYSAEEAIAKLIRGTPLTLSTDSSGALLIAAPLATTTMAAQNSPGMPDGQPSPEQPRSSLQLAQATPGQTSSPSTVENASEQPPKSKSVPLEEVIVTGTRIPIAAKDASQQVKVYTSEQIAASGQTSVAEFLNTLPQVSTVMDQSNFQAEGTSVRLHGLPLGTTLVLIDGRRVESPGGMAASSNANIFDLSNIPLTAVERIEVVPVGSSAVYGSDGIAGVVNIILKKDFSGFEGSVKYGAATGTDSSMTSLAWGSHWDSGALTAVGSYATTSQLLGSDRALTANGNYTALGGPDTRFYFANPGNVFSTNGSNLPGLNAAYAAVPVGFKGPPSQAEFAATAGTLNQFSYESGASLIPKVNQASILLSFHQEVSRDMQLFAQTLYSNRRQTYEDPAPFLFGFPGYQQFTVSASNPYNPFGQTVGVAYLFPEPSQSPVQQDLTFVQPTLGLRGSFFQAWSWEVSGSWSDEADRPVFAYQLNSTAIQDALNSSNAVTALNPFIDGSPGSSQLLQSLFYSLTYRYRSTRALANAFMRGPIITLPSGDVDLVLGTEYLRDRLTSSQYNPTDPSAGNPLNLDAQSTGRSSSAVFAEAHIPLLPKRLDGSDSLALDGAGRYDHYSDVGGKATFQVGGHWRPVDSLVIRSTWGEAFKAPSLLQLHLAQTSFPTPLFDPVTNQQVVAAVISGGNLNLRPEEGQSQSLGVVYDSQAIAGLQLGISQWHIEETNSINTLGYQTIVDNASLFPGAVTRESSCASGPPCPIVTVQDGYVNFGDINVSGIDYDASYRLPSVAGTWSAAISVAEIYRYTAAFLPGLPPTDRLSVANDGDYDWAPRWKGTVNLGWSVGSLTTGVTGRYTSKYRDYEPLADGQYQSLGNFWLFDVSGRLDIGKSLWSTSAWAKGTFVELGGINVLNRLPQFSTINGGHPGYDYMEADIRGRFVYARLGIAF
jgi:iron complex outermembrane receptor protein